MNESPLAVMPVLVGPLQVLLALLPAILAALGGMFLALFKPSTFKRLGQFLWHQKLFTACLVAVVVLLWQGYPQRLWSGSRAGGEVTEDVRDSAWPLVRGGPERSGWNGAGDDPTSPGNIWAWTDHRTVFCSPTVAGGRVYFSTVTGLGAFDREGKGAIVCADAETGKELWRYDAGGKLRATFSAPVIGDERIVVGEGLHETQNARITCLDLSGRRIWEYRAKGHVEASACICGGRAYVAAADDGLYCFDLTPNADGTARVVWHLSGEKYPDCESSAVCDGKTVWFGLGEGGDAVVAVDAATGEERWRAKTPFPVFTPPALAGGKIFVGVGNGNFVQSAEDVRRERIERMREEGRPAAEIEAAFKDLAPGGAVWCLNAATGNIDWKHPLKETVLDSISVRDGRLYFGIRNGDFVCLTTQGELLAEWNAGAPILAAPAVGRSHAYLVTNAGRLHCLKADSLQPVWDLKLQPPGVMASAPTLAGGHVYVGSELEGLRCVGTTEPPPPPVWNDGPRGRGPDGPIPEKVRVAWQYPPAELESNSPGPKRFQPASLMPLGDSLFVLGTEPPDDLPEGLSEDELAARRKTPWNATLLKLDLSKGTSESKRCVWARKIGQGEIHAGGLCGSGDSVLVRSGLRPERDRVAQFTCIDAGDGSQRWQRSLGLASTSDPVVSRDRVFCWNSEVELQAIDLQSGGVVWKRYFQARNFQNAPSPRMTPALAGSILLVSLKSNAKSIGSIDNNRGWTYLIEALDAETGTSLWSAFCESAGGSPIVVDKHLVRQGIDGLEAIRLTDGGREWFLKRDIVGPVVQAGPTLLANVNGSKLVWIDPRDGSTVDELSLPKGSGRSAPPLDDGRRILFCQQTGWILWDRQEGEWSAWFKPPAGTGFGSTPLVFVGQRAYCGFSVGATRGRVVCLEEEAGP